MGENEKGKQWWEVSRFVPEGKMDVVLLACGGAAVLFLVLTIVGFSVASSRGSRLTASEANVESLSTKGVPRDITAKIERLEREAERARNDLAASQEKVKELNDKLRASGGLSGQLERAQREKEALDKKIEALNTDKEKLAQTANDRAGEIRSLQADKKKLEREASAAEALRKEKDRLKETLDQKEKDLTDLRSAERSGSTEMARLKRDSDARIAELEEELDDSEKSIKILTSQLAEFPGKPLPDEEATRRYEATKAKVEAIEIQDVIPDHEKRLAIWLMAKRVLAGTNYERTATSDWERAKKQKQTDIDKAAADLHKVTLEKTREQPDEYDRNIKMLSDILQDVHMKESPRNVKAVEGSIARQKQAKQAAFDRAAGDVYRDVLAKNREDREAYDEHIRELERALAEVRNSPRYVKIIEGAIEKEKALKARAEARAAREAGR